jgi:hypothetical protein
MPNHINLDFSDAQDPDVIAIVKRLDPKAQAILERSEQSESLFLGARAIELLMEDLQLS